MSDKGDAGEWLDDDVHQCASASQVDATSRLYVYRIAFVTYDLVTDRDRDDYRDRCHRPSRCRARGTPLAVHVVEALPSRSFDLLHDEDAMCGRHVKLLSPQLFDPDATMRARRASSGTWSAMRRRPSISRQR